MMLTQLAEELDLRKYAGADYVAGKLAL